MSSTLFKAVFAGAVTVGALLLPVTAAQAAPKHLPCDDPGFSDGAFVGDGFGFLDAGFGDDDGFGQDDGFGFPDGGFGFHQHHRQHHYTTIIIVNNTSTNKHKHKHHKPAVSGNATAAGYHKPSATSNGDDGYRKNS